MKKMCTGFVSNNYTTYFYDSPPPSSSSSTTKHFEFEFIYFDFYKQKGTYHNKVKHKQHQLTTYFSHGNIDY